MAKRGSKSKTATPESDLPEGFETVASARGDGWYIKEAGNQIWGELLGRFRKRKSLNDADSFFYQIMIEKPVRASRKEEEETIEVTLEPGQIVNVDETSSLQDLAPLLIESSKRWRVVIEAIDKVKIPGTAQTFWRFKIGKQAITSANEPRVKPRETDVPF